MLRNLIHGVCFSLAVHALKQIVSKWNQTLVADYAVGGAYGGRVIYLCSSTVVHADMPALERHRTMSRGQNAAEHATSPIGLIMKALKEPINYKYAGLCRKRASVIALDLTKTAATTGQIELLTKHLNLLAPIITRP